MQTLAGRTCVFAGATAGDGVAVVHALCKGGMNVIMMTHSLDQALALEKEISQLGYPGRCKTVAGSHGPAEEDPAVYASLEKEFGSVDVIISNTGGYGRETTLEGADPDEMLREIDHLCVGSFRMLQAALPFLRKSRAPRAIFMSTVEGVNGGVHQSFINSVAKGAVRSLTVNAAARLAAEGITVNCVAKGGIPRVEGLHPGDPDPVIFASRSPMGRMGTPEELGEVICFLASEESGYITGQCIALDGGYSLRD